MEILSLEKLKKYPTPFYYYDTKLLKKTLDLILNLTKDKDISIQFAIKSNFNEKILKIISSYGIGADCVSGGEVKLALECGFPANKIVYAGVGKTDEEISYAIDQDIFCFNCESFEEIDNINNIAKQKNKKIKIGLRVNPNVDAHTLDKITTGLDENKFGIYLDDKNFYDKIKNIYFGDEYKNLNIIGLHFHVGSQILDFNNFIPLCKKIDQIIYTFDKLNIKINYLDLGGGCGIDYLDPNKNPIPDFKGYIDTYLNNIKSLSSHPDIKIHFEPGRSIVGQSGNLITKCVYVKKGINKKFIVLDAGMNDLVRPAMYGAYHKIEKILDKNEKGEEKEKYDVVGPICESSDVFGKNIELPISHKNDLFVIRSSGAYGESMACRYNFRPLIKGYLDTEF